MPQQRNQPNLQPEAQSKSVEQQENYIKERDRILRSSKIKWFEIGEATAESISNPKQENETEKNEKQRKQNKISERARETVEKDILPVIKDKYPELSDKQILEHPMIAGEIVPVIISGYEVKKPYILYKNETGFILKSEPMKYGEKPLPEYRFTYSDFEDSLKRPAEKIVEEDSALEKAKMKEYEWEGDQKIEEAYKRNFPNLREENIDMANLFQKGVFSSEEFEEITKLKLDEVAAKNYELTQVNEGIKDLVGEIMEMHRNGETKSNIGEIVRKNPALAKYHQYREVAEKKKDYETVAAIDAYGNTIETLLESHGIEE
ncbi:hypothetical protein COU74_02125 [Candidatus Peregrinibacteria bacterium CG10_big_fil_rev_8_21_14_0_10_36_19]|nr:MAG: hypothetical protein COU74_02125 [Candidatus Peregrinibacteria bacterium CG10_big_fil_rev_8_21_14_0_10_36_19]